MRNYPREVTQRLSLRAFPKELAQRISLAVLSPGKCHRSGLCSVSEEQKIPVWGEIELAYNYGKAELLPLPEYVVRQQLLLWWDQLCGNTMRNVYIVGNIGNPYTQAAPLMDEGYRICSRISSFQLETIEYFHPQVSAILNITPDHLNRHHTMENYIAAKEAITMNQTKDDYCILNYEECIYQRIWRKRCPATVVFFSSARRLDNGLFYEGEGHLSCKKR